MSGAGDAEPRAAGWDDGTDAGGATVKLTHTSGLAGGSGAIGVAFELAFAAHDGQTDKAGLPYIAHVVRVAAALERPEDRVVALLHDVVEDCDVGLEEIAARFGHEIAAAVDAISKRAGEPQAAYLERVAANPIARRVKLADLADNGHPVRLHQLDQATQVRLTVKYAHARARLEGSHG